MTQVIDVLREIAPLCEVESVSEIFSRFTTLQASEFNVKFLISFCQIRSICSLLLLNISTLRQWRKQKKLFSNELNFF